MAKQEPSHITLGVTSKGAKASRVHSGSSGAPCSMGSSIATLLQTPTLQPASTPAKWPVHSGQCLYHEMAGRGGGGEVEPLQNGL